MASLFSPAIAQSTALPSLGRPGFLTPLQCSCSRLFSQFGATSHKLSPLRLRLRNRHVIVASSVEEEQTEVIESTVEEEEEEVEEVEIEATPEELEYISEIQSILELLKQNRDMTFGEVKLTVMIEDPRDIERKRLLGIEDDVTKDDLADALVDVHEGRVPKNRDALKLLARELSEWPEIEASAPRKKGKPTKSLYAKATDTGIDPETAAKRLNIDWDSAADIDEEEEADEVEVPPVVGYGALYLVSAFPILIGIAVVLILFYNSLQ